MHTVHSGYSIVIPIKPGKMESTRQILFEINRDPAVNKKILFNEITTAHFVTCTILPEQNYQNRKLPATLLIATSYCGPDNVHLEELVKFGCTGLRELFQNCEGYPDNNFVSDNDLKLFIKKHRHWDTFYSGMQYVTPQDIQREDQLRQYIQDLIDGQHFEKHINENSCKEIKKLIEEHVAKEQKFDWARKPWKRSIYDLIYLNRSLIISVLIALVITSFLIFFNKIIILIILGLALISLIIIILGMRMYEKGKQFVAGRQPDEQVKLIMSSQKHPVINEMTVCSPLKEGRFRPFFFQLALRAVNLTRGWLKIPTVATARWMAIDKGKRMVFISNFTNLSESYVRDFIDNESSAQKINLLFGQGDGYPPTKWILKGGALENPNAFMDVVFLYQHVTDLWFCRCRHLSIDNININRRIRQGLFTEMSEDKSREWLQLL